MSVLMQRLSYLTETVLSNNITRTRINIMTVLEKPLRQRAHSANSKLRTKCVDERRDAPHPLRIESSVLLLPRRGGAPDVDLEGRDGQRSR